MLSLGREWDWVLHRGRQPSNWEPCITRAQAPGGKEAGSPVESWEEQGSACVSSYGERKLRDRSAEPLGGKE